jgi:hypothetical protein
VRLQGATLTQSVEPPIGLKAWHKNQTGRRLERLAKAWDCSMSAAVERLIMEADKNYSDILFPEFVVFNSRMEN